MLYVDGMNGLICHNETVQWLYSLVGSKFRLVVKTALKLLLVFVEYTESNATLLIQAVNAVDAKRGTKFWSNIVEILDEKDGVDTELLVYAMTLINKTLAGLPDQDQYYDVVDSLEEQGLESLSQRHLSRKGTDLDLVEQFNIYETVLRHEDGDEETQVPPSGRKERRRASVGCGSSEGRGLERRRSRRHSLQSSRGHVSAPSSPSTHGTSFMSFAGPISEREEEEYDEDEEEEGEEEEDDPDSESHPVIECSSQGAHSGVSQALSLYLSSSAAAASMCLGFNCLAQPPPGPSVPEVQSSTPVSTAPSQRDYNLCVAETSHANDFNTTSLTSRKPCWVERIHSSKQQPPPSPVHRLSSAADSRADRAAGGLLSSSYRQHQEALATEREKKRQEREERLLKVERDERSRCK
uniref:GBD/FH3 domain-containing protein n=1 Tax=Knipowitschia caucasica TaxID=637954 RepID=A0AAV2MD94_KNICA